MALHSGAGALVLFSGGQDSTTCLVWALDRYDRVETIGFDYGQRHSVELECRQNILSKIKSTFPSWSSHLGIDHLIDLSSLGQISETSLTREAEIHLNADGLPNTFVPGRNLLFLTFAAAVAYRRNLNVLVGGMCETDFSGYPDCRDNTIKAMQVALSLGTGKNVCIETPLMWMDKSMTWELAWDLGGEKLLEMVRIDTHTCYLGNRTEFYEWGYGCGNCPSCILRSEGYAKWLCKRKLNSFSIEN
jgi:7-cyano-7-deazaguanine synthase